MKIFSTDPPSPRLFLIMPTRLERSMLAEGLRKEGFHIYVYESAQEFFRDKENQEFGVVLISMKHAGMDGLEVVDRLKNETHAFPVVLLASKSSVGQAIKTGVEFVLTCSPEEVSAAVRRIEIPEVFDENQLHRGFSRLSSLEREVLDLVAKGFVSREIAVMLDISANTVEARRLRINAKTRAKDVGELLRMWDAWKALK